MSVPSKHQITAFCISYHACNTLSFSDINSQFTMLHIKGLTLTSGMCTYITTTTLRTGFLVISQQHSEHIVIKMSNRTSTERSAPHFSEHAAAGPTLKGARTMKSHGFKTVIHQGQSQPGSFGDQTAQGRSAQLRNHNRKENFPETYQSRPSDRNSTHGSHYTLGGDFVSKLRPGTMFSLLRDHIHRRTGLRLSAFQSSPGTSICTHPSGYRPPWRRKKRLFVPSIWPKGFIVHKYHV